MKEIEIYTNELLKFNPTLRFIFGMRDKSTLSHYENHISDDYFHKIRELMDKYRDTQDIELKNEIFSNDLYLNNHLYLLLFSSHENQLLLFDYQNNIVYPKNETYKKSRSQDFDDCVRWMIIRAKQGLEMKITYPKIIIKKFLNQIKHLDKYKSLYQFIKKEYYPKCRSEIGLCYIPNGKEIYRQVIKEFVGFLDITPEEIYKLGLSLEKKIITHKDKYNSKEELFDDCLHHATYIYEHVIDKYFHYKLNKPFRILKVPKELESSSSLAYYNETEAAVFINLSYYKDVNKNDVYSLLMHECFHYYHFEFMKFYKIPKYKIHIYSNIALVEGFAHYMETCCENYDDNNHYSLLRKLRLVIDTGINYYGWTYKQAHDYLNKYIPNNKSDNANEVDRAICDPGQLLSYYIGKIHIVQLRDEYLKKGGNIKDFHHRLLMEGLASFKTIDKIIMIR
jgi:uncharacterized protein (DUF885 family)